MALSVSTMDMPGSKCWLNRWGIYIDMKTVIKLPSSDKITR